MAIVNQVQKKIRMDLWDITKFQISVYCQLNNIVISVLDLNCLTLLALSGEVEITEFCDTATKEKIFGSSQSVRNAIVRLEKRFLITKIGRSKKKIKLNPSLNVQTKGNILLDFKIVRVES